MKPDYIYIIHQGESRLFKIGVSNDPKRRLRALQTGNPHPLTLLRAFKCSTMSAYRAEAAIHQHLAASRRKGEWFEIDTDDRVVAIAGAIINALS